jgi:SAM-dependent methyltransferase
VKLQTTCKLCGSDGISLFFEHDDRMLRCNRCGVGFLSPALVTYNPDEYYGGESHYGCAPNERTQKLAAENAKEVLRYLVKFIEPRGRSLIDIGAHHGIFVREANAAGFQANGIEPNAAAQQWAKRHGIPVAVSRIEQFGTTAPLDVVTMFHVLEHLPDPIGSLRKARALLKENGLLVLEVPNSDSYLARKDGMSWKFIAFEHLFYFSEENISGILKRAGYKVLTIKKRNFELSRLNIRKLIRYFVGRGSSRNRFFIKKESSAAGLVNDGFLKSLIRKILIFFIRVLGREDHILVIAQKC